MSWFSLFHQKNKTKNEKKNRKEKAEKDRTRKEEKKNKKKTWIKRKGRERGKIDDNVHCLSSIVSSIDYNLIRSAVAPTINNRL